MKKLKFNGKPWRIRHVHKIRYKGIRRLVGLCVWSKREILIKIGEPERDTLGTTIHEGLHACFPWLDEDAVIAAEKSLQTLLWNEGWRQQPKQCGQ